jgi:sodium transport system permease protein
MNWKQTWTVFAKELRDSMRDRRTVISMIVFPALIMPGLMFGFGFVSFKLVSSAKQEIPAVMLIGQEHAPELHALLKGHSKLRLVPAAPDFRDQISSKRIRAALEIPPGFETAVAAGENATLRIFTYDGEMKSGFATGEIEKLLREHRDALVARKLSERNLPGTFVRPFEIKRENVAPPEKVGGNLFGGFVPYLIILLAFIGAMYPAIDLTAGEKERGTMETILCSPVGRVELVLGKFLTVLTISLGTVLVSATSLGISGIAMAAVFQKKLMAAASTAGAKAASLPMIDPLGVMGVFLLVLPVAVMFSAVLLSTALFAKSHKEAQSYVSPLMIVIVMPSLAAMLPGVELSRAASVVPVLNVSLLSKELVSGSFPWANIALTFGSSCLYAGIALFIAVKLFNRESVLFRT